MTILELCRLCLRGCQGGGSDKIEERHRIGGFLIKASNRTKINRVGMTDKDKREIR